MPPQRLRFRQTFSVPFLLVSLFSALCAAQVVHVPSNRINIRHFKNNSIAALIRGTNKTDRLNFHIENGCSFGA